MDKSEQKRLKKLGKEIVAQRSLELRNALATANPAPISSDTWAANYREQSYREKELRNNPPDFILPNEAKERWVSFSADQLNGPEFPRVSGCFYECLTCGGLLHSSPHALVACACGNVTIKPKMGHITIRQKLAVRFVKLLAKT